ncbi:NADPH2:quinone reductase [Lipingzhangella halophila]|uniref:NADPH2:quinone reductase n=1 Tax=Lipingzhangella halophila TaxID=1783352 RepID=A0A7W7RJW9_9ACTN|nr:quinone oxidoreductase [Lipingzhangella halophila]MBB4933324.1 NADPH2:quinone reductase [Lipingzhangella halophila]
MRAIVIEQQGGPEVMHLTEVADPEPGPGQVSVDLEASGVNFIDIYQRSGSYPMPTPFTPGLEGAGTISAVGSGVTGLTAGQRVAWAQQPGSYAARAIVSADRAVPVPDGVSAEVAAAVMLQGLTAHYLTHSTYPIQPGDTVLVHAAAGGTGLLLTQLAKLRGARVIATVSTEEKELLARGAGADEVIHYAAGEMEQPPDVAAVVRELTGGAGVAAVYDGVGASTFDASLDSLRPRGVLALFGQSSGVVPPVDPQRLNSAGSVYLTRPSLVHHVAEREEYLERASDILGLVGTGKLDVRIGARYPLADAARAHEDLASRKTTGKLLLT